MESIEKLREFAETPPHVFREELIELADEIEREIAEKYMERRVDADGVPIRMGDTVEGELLLDNATVRGTVRAFHLYDDEPDTVNIKVNIRGEWTIKELRLTRCRHVKPDPVNELLNNFLEEYDASIRPDEEIIARYAIKIREAVMAE